MSNPGSKIPYVSTGHRAWSAAAKHTSVSEMAYGVQQQSACQYRTWRMECVGHYSAKSNARNSIPGTNGTEKVDSCL
eukprot:2184336-Rhodomonas_salina.2